MEEAEIAARKEIAKKINISKRYGGGNYLPIRNYRILEVETKFRLQNTVVKVKA